MFLNRQNGCYVINFDIFREYSRLKAVVSTRQTGLSSGAFGSLNMGYNTEDCDSKVAANRRRFCNSIGIPMESLAWVQQIHGSDIAQVDTFGEIGKFDGLISGEGGIFLTITTADCIPIFLYNKYTDTLALLHAGWRGIAKGIIPSGVEMLCGKSNSEPDGIIAALGPHIRSCCYSVSDDVADRFSSTFISKGKKGKWYLDLTACTVTAMRQSGVRISNIEHQGYCTSCEEEYYYSHRRDRGITGRMMALFGKTKGSVTV